MGGLDIEELEKYFELMQGGSVHLLCSNDSCLMYACILPGLLVHYYHSSLFIYFKSHSILYFPFVVIAYESVIL